MKKIKLENITLNLYCENGNVRVKYNGENIILNNQNIQNISMMISDNFDLVYSYYKSKAVNNSESTNVIAISISIVLQYLYMYNTWKNTYKNKANLDLKFNDQDFNNPITLDIIMSFYRKKYPTNWMEKCNMLLGMTVKELQSYYVERNKFYKK